MRSLLLAALLLAPPVAAQDAPIPAPDERFRLGVGFGTGGLTIEPAWRDQQYAIRGTLAYGRFDADAEFEGTDYDVDVSVGHIGVLVDAYPARDGLRFTFGAIYPFDRAEVSAEADSITIGGMTFTDGQVEGDVEPNWPVQPLAAIGYSVRRQNLSIDFDLGARFVGGWSADLRTGSDSAVTIPQSELDAEEETIEDELERFPLVPYAKVGVTFRF